MSERMHPFLRCIAAGLAVTFVGSIIAVASCAHTPERHEFDNLGAIAAKTARHIAPVVYGLIGLVR